MNVRHIDKAHFVRCSTTFHLVGGVSAIYGTIAEVGSKVLPGLGFEWLVQEGKH